METHDQKTDLRKSLEICAPTHLRDLGDGYQKAFVTFIDVLGFKDMVGGLEPEKINKLLDAMQMFSSLPQRRREPYNLTENLPIVVQFSDSIIRIQPTDDVGEEESALNFFVGELGSLLLAQGNLACNGVLIRGGITYGDICVHKQRIFGPAFVRAYKIETSLARYPRIVVDEALCINSSENLIARAVGNSMWQAAMSDVLEYLHRSDDGQWSIDYLPHMYDAERDVGVSGTDMLLAHRDSIRRQLSAALASKCEDRIAKVRWAANYHNAVLARAFQRINSKFEENDDSLFVEIDGRA